MNATRTHFFPGTCAADLMPVFADVESYPAFVPGYRSAKIIARNGSIYQTVSVMALQLGLLTLEEELRSVTIETYPFCIEVYSVGSRFIRSLRNTWRFKDRPGGCEVTFMMALDPGPVPWMVRPMVDAFAEREADAILQAFVARVASFDLAAAA